MTAEYRKEIIERLERIAGHAVHTVGEEPFVMSLDDGIAVHKAIEVLERSKKGHWEPIGYDGYADGSPVIDEWECSECREEHYGDSDTLTPFCPNCGADMRAESEEV